MAKRKKDKQYKTKYRATRTPLKTGGELRLSANIQTLTLLGMFRRLCVCIMFIHVPMRYILSW